MEYFDKLFNGEQKNVVWDTTIIPLDENREFIWGLQKSEVNGALKKMKLKKAVGQDGIPIEVWICLGANRVTWLTDQFNKIWRTNKMPIEWRKYCNAY